MSPKGRGLQSLLELWLSAWVYDINTLATNAAISFDSATRSSLLVAMMILDRCRREAGARDATQRHERQLTDNLPLSLNRGGVQTSWRDPYPQSSDRQSSGLEGVTTRVCVQAKRCLFL